MRILFLCTTILLLAACKSVDDLQHESIMLPEKYAQNEELISIDSLANTDSTKLVLNYPSFFNDSLLVALIDSALIANPDLRIANARIMQARSGMLLTKGLRAPHLGLSINNGVQRFGSYTIDGVGNYDTQFSPNLTADQQIPNPVPDYYAGFYSSWEIDIWGKLKNQKKAAQNRFLSSEFGRNVVMTDLIAELAIKYYTLLSLDRELQIISQNILLQENALELVKAQMESGHTTELGIQLIKAQVLSAKNLYIEVEQEIIENENAINILLGRYPQPVARTVFTGVEPFFAKLEVGVPSALLRQRPDIKMAEHELLASRADLKSAKAAFYPSIVLSGTFGLQSFNAALLLDAPASITYNLLGGMVQPLLNRRQLKAQLMESKGKEKEAYIQYEKTILNAFTEVYGLLKMDANLNNMIELKSKEVQILEESVETAKALFFSGRSNYLDIITAQERFLETQIEMLKIDQKSHFNQIKLYKSLGGGW